MLRFYDNYVIMPILYTFRTSNFVSAGGGLGVLGRFLLLQNRHSRHPWRSQRLCQHGAGIEPTWTYSRRPLTGTPRPNFHLR